MFDVHKSRGHPVYLQIVQQVERRIAAGALSPGDALPSVRAMASELGINPNTVVRAYRELETLGLVESQHGQGTFVAHGAGGRSPARRLLDEHAQQFVGAAQELGVDEAGSLAAVERAWKQGSDHV